jgi:flagellar FliL protein
MKVKYKSLVGISIAPIHFEIAFGGCVAEEKKGAEPVHENVAKPGGQKSAPFIILSIVNMVVVAVVGAMMYIGKKKEAAEPKIEHVIKGEHEQQKEDEKQELGFVKEMIKLESFVVNMAGSRGRRIARVTMELDVDNDKVKDEIESRHAQIRDIIIIILSSKTLESVSTKEGKDGLREEIRDTVSGFLTKGKIKKVYFTEFIYN